MYICISPKTLNIVLLVFVLNKINYPFSCVLVFQLKKCAKHNTCNEKNYLMILTYDISFEKFNRSHNLILSFHFIC